MRRNPDWYDYGRYEYGARPAQSHEYGGGAGQPHEYGARPARPHDYGYAQQPAMPQHCDLPLAQAYVHIQPWGEQYSYQEALMKGTLWPALYRPYP